jgi:DNA repair exonuclease SbcCD ATPase subunit
LNVRRLTLSHFMSHEKTDIALPEHGVVAVQGPNGAGKSSLVEAVSVAFWGKTLRGSSPWREGEGGHVEVETDLATADRDHGPKGKLRLAWQATGDADKAALRLQGKPLGADEFETTTKAQEALEAIVGPHDIWRRTAVFSSQDAAHFTQATDGERKRLLESILQLGRFDDALERCRDQLRVVIHARSELRMREQEAFARHDAACAVLVSAEADLEAHGEAPDTKALRLEVDECSDAVKSFEADIKELRDQLREAEVAGAEQLAEAAAREREAKRLESGACPTCGQSTKELFRIARAEVAKLRHEAKAAKEKADAAGTRLRGELGKLEDDRDDAVAKRAKFAAELAGAAKVKELRRRAEVAKVGAVAAVEKWAAVLAQVRAAAAEADHDEAELEACERVLGLKGVRATVLGKALKGVEVAANAWLGRIAGAGLRLKLRAYTEKKSGGVSDSISLDVDGAGGGNGYRGASGGERRRIDVALLLALADIAAAAVGREPGTLFFDEVFDALDQDGVGAVSAAVGELARSRCVVVVTHSESLAAALPASTRLRVDGGVMVQRTA